MATVTWKVKEDTLTAANNAMLSRAGTMEAFFNQVVFKLYRNAQQQRWQTQGGSENTPWRSLTEKYSLLKKKKFASYQFSGSQMLIATGTLYQGTVTNPYKFVSKDRLVVSVNPQLSNPESEKPLEGYAKYVASERPIMKFSPDTVSKIRKALSSYIKNGGGSI